MSTKNMDQIQVRIDSKTKNEARKILEGLGLDISTAVKMMCKQIIFTKSLPYEIRDEHGFTPKKAQELREAIIEAKNSTKAFTSVNELMKDIEP